MATLGPDVTTKPQDSSNVTVEPVNGPVVGLMLDTDMPDVPEPLLTDVMMPWELTVTLALV
jgi:hypothetical protein